MHRFSLEVEDSAGDRTLAAVDIVVIQLAVEPTSWSAVKRLLRP